MLAATLLLSGLVLAACSDDDDETPATTGGDSTAARQQQIDAGATLYIDNCADCHGDMGQGTDVGPPLVGPDALPLEPRPEQTVRTGQFVTAFDVYDFARENMPLSNPGVLADDEYLAIVAFDLDANGVEWQGALSEDDLMDIVINPSNAPTGSP